MVKDILFIAYMLSILISAASSIAFQKWLKRKKLILFLPFLTYVFAQEVFLYFNTINGWYSSNNFVYNILRLLTIIVFAALYYNLPFMKAVRKYVLALAVLYTVAFIINFVFIQSITEHSSYFGLSRGLIVSMFGILFLFSYFKYEDTTELDFWLPWIWVTTGIMIFYPVVSISQTFQPYLKEAEFYGFKLYQLIPQVMSIFMYSCFSYAFYLCKRKS